MNTNDTVYVNSGSSEGSFVLNFFFQIILYAVPELFQLTIRCPRAESFSYSVTGRNVQLEWTTSSELNNSGFLKFKELQAQELTVLGFVKVTAL